MFSSELGEAAAAELGRSIPFIVRKLLVRLITPAQMDRLPFTSSHRFEVATERLRHVIDTVIAEYRASGVDHDDLLSALLRAHDPDTGEAMSDVLVRDNLVTFAMAGSETVSSTLAWAFHELARHPEIESRLQAEVDSVAGASAVTYEDLDRLEYTGRVVSETLRLHGLLLVLRRGSAAMELGGARLPAGADLAFSPYALHRDPRLYPDPLRFDPDRWLPERSSTLPKGAFIPFAAGAHKCIGDGFAVTEATIVLATIVGSWRLRPVPGHVVREVVSQIPYPDALPMTAIPRHA
jgi:cytochrome P450